MKLGIFLNIVIGAVFTGCLLAIVGYFATITSPHGGFLGAERDWWLIAVITDLVVGSVIGGLSAIVIAGFNLSYVKAIIFCAVLNLLIVLRFYIFANGQMSQSIKYPLFALIPIGLLNGVLVSWFAYNPQSLK